MKNGKFPFWKQRNTKKEVVLRKWKHVATSLPVYLRFFHGLFFTVWCNKLVYVGLNAKLADERSLRITFYYLHAFFEYSVAKISSIFNIMVITKYLCIVNVIKNTFCAHISAVLLSYLEFYYVIKNI